MSAEKHSPLPWMAEDDRVMMPNTMLVAECYGGSTHESIANAAIIVCAVNGAEIISSIWEDPRIRLNVHKDYPELAEAIDKLLGHK